LRLLLYLCVVVNAQVSNSGSRFEVGECVDFRDLLTKNQLFFESGIGHFYEVLSAFFINLNCFFSAVPQALPIT